jgi:hypothetical protein
MATARRLWGQAWFLLANKRLGKRKFSLPRLLSWSLALATAASVVVLSTFLLTQTNTETSYAAGPPAEIYGHFDFNRYNNVVGWNCGGDNCQHDWNIAFSSDSATLAGYSQFGSFNARAHCMDGLAFWFPTAKTYNDIKLTLVSSDSATGILKYTGTVLSGNGANLTGDGNQRLFIEAYFSWDFTPSQPVTESTAAAKISGETLTDQIKVLEANGDTGEKLSAADSKWDKTGSNLSNSTVCVDVYGPFYSQQARNPASNQTPIGRYFAMDKQVVSPEIKGSDVTVIGDEVALASESSIKAINQTNPKINLSAAKFYDTAGQNLAGALALVQSASTEIGKYLVLAIGANDFGLNQTQYKEQLIALVNAAKARVGTDGYVVLMTPFNASGITSATDMIANQYPMQKVFDFETVINDMVSKDSRVALLNWTQTDSLNGDDALYVRNGYGLTDSPKDDVYRWNSKLLTNGLVPTAYGQNVFANKLANALKTFLSGGSVSYTGGAAQWGSGFSKGPDAGVSYPGEAQSSLRVGRKCFNTNDTGTKTTPPGANGWSYDVNFSGVTLSGSHSTWSNNSANWPAGTYYFVSNVSKDTGANSWAQLNNWYSPFAETSEQVTTKINFGTTSTVSANYLNPANVSSFKDTLTIAPYKASSTATEGPSNKVSRYDTSNKLSNSNWPQAGMTSKRKPVTLALCQGPSRTIVSDS